MYIKFFQSAFFLSSINLSNKLNLASEVLTKFNDLIDGEPMILPIPENAPLEIPRIILKSKNQEYEIDISFTRVDFIYNNKTNTQEEYVAFSSRIKKIVNDLSTILIDKYSMTTNRIGIILTLGANENTLDKAISFFKDEYTEIKNKKEIHINWLEKRDIEEFKVNDWIRIVAQDVDNNRPKYTITNDLNIVANGDAGNLTKDLIKKFYNITFKEMKKNISQYEPDNVN